MAFTIKLPNSRFTIHLPEQPEGVIRAPRPTDVRPGIGGHIDRFIESGAFQKVVAPGRIPGDVASGVAGTAASTLQIPSLIKASTGSDNAVLDAVSRKADDMSRMFQKVSEKFRPEDPNFIDEVAQGFGSTGVFFLPGLGTASALNSVAMVAPRLALALGAGASTVFEAGVEAAATFNSLKQQGVDEQTAAREAETVFGKNLATIYVTNLAGPFANRGRTLSRLARTSATEATQEGLQSRFQQQAQNRQLGTPIDLMQDLRAAGVGAIVGGGVGGAMGGVTQGRPLSEVVGREISPEEAKISQAGRIRIGRGVDKATGVSKPRTPVTIPSEEVALRQQIRREAGLARQAARAGKEGERLKAVSRIKQLNQKTRDLRATSAQKLKTKQDRLLGERAAAKHKQGLLREQIKARPTPLAAFKTALAMRKGGIKVGAKEEATRLQKIKKDISSVVEGALPVQERGRFLPMIANAKTTKDVAKAASRAQVAVEEIEKKTVIRDITKISKRAIDSMNVEVGYKARIKILLNDLQFKKTTQSRLSRVQGTEKFLQNQIAQGKDVALPMKILSELRILSRKPVSEMSLVELDHIRDQVELFEKIGRTKQRSRGALQAIEKKHLLDQISKDAVPLEEQEVLQSKPGEKLKTEEQFKSGFQEVWRRVQLADVSLMPMDVVFDRLDGGKNYEGTLYRIFKKSSDIKFSNFLEMRDQMLDPVNDLIRELGMTDQNFERIGIHATRVQPNGIRVLRNSGLTLEQIDGIKLNDKEMQVYNKMMEIKEKWYPTVRELVRVVENREIGKVKNHFPFQTDFQKMNEEETDTRLVDSLLGFQKDTDLRTKTVEKGFVEERVQNRKKPIKLNARDIYRQHMNDVAYYITMRQHIKTMFEVSNTDQFRESAGALGQKVVLDWVDTMARQGGASGQRSILLLDTLRKNVGAAKLGFKLSSILIQPTALFDGAARIGPKWVFQGVQDVTRKEVRQFLLKNSSELRKRVGDDPIFLEFDPNKPLQSSQNKGLALLKLFDSMTASAVLSGAYRKALSRKGVHEIDASKPDKEAFHRAELELRRTQSSAFFKDLPQALSRGKFTAALAGGRGGNRSLDKSLFLFQSFIINRFSLVRHDLASLGIKGGNTELASRIAVWLILANIAEAGIRGGVRVFWEFALSGSDEAKKKAQDELDNMPSRTVREMLGSVPFLGNIVSVATFRGDPFAITSPIRDLSIGLGSVTSAKSASSRLKGLTRVAEGVGSFAGIPGSSQVGQVIRKIADNKKPENRRKAILDRLRKINSRSKEASDLRKELMQVSREIGTQKRNRALEKAKQNRRRLPRGKAFKHGRFTIQLPN